VHEVLVFPPAIPFEVLKENVMTINQVTDNQPATALAPEALVEQLRAMRAQIPDLAPLTPAQRRELRQRGQTPNPILQASINVIGALGGVEQAIGHAPETVRELHDQSNRWTAVEDELRTMLNGVVGANLIRRQRVALIAAQAYTIGQQLARDPANAVLLPHVQEIKRLKSFARRKKAEQAPDSPPATPPAASPSIPQT
jgi:hypothetical protein